MTRDFVTLQVGEGWFPDAPGGLTRYYHDLVHQLPPQGVGVAGLVVGEPRLHLRTAGTVTAFAPADAPLWRRWAACRRHARRALVESRPAVVASHFALYAAPLLDVLGERPLVSHFHGPWALESRVEGAPGLAERAKLALEQRVYAHSTRLVTLSQAFADVLIHRYGISPERVRVVPGGIDAARFADGPTRRTARETLGWPLDRPIVFCCRRLTRRMGLENLLEASEALRAAVPDALVLIAGRGPLGPALAAQIEARALGRHVKLLGALTDSQLTLAYRAADLGVVPTLALEGFGLVVAEALAAGTPSIVTPIGGLIEVVSPLAPELAADSARPEAIARALIEALRGERRLPTAEACRAYARARFDWPIVAERLRGVYEEARS